MENFEVELTEKLCHNLVPTEIRVHLWVLVQVIYIFKIVMKFLTNLMFIIPEMVEKWVSSDVQKCGVRKKMKYSQEWVYFKFIATCSIIEWNSHPSGRARTYKALVTNDLGSSPSVPFCVFHIILPFFCLFRSAGLLDLGPHHFFISPLATDYTTGPLLFFFILDS